MQPSPVFAANVIVAEADGSSVCDEQLVGDCLNYLRTKGFKCEHGLSHKIYNGQNSPKVWCACWGEYDSNVFDNVADRLLDEFPPDHKYGVSYYGPSDLFGLAFACRN